MVRTAVCGVANVAVIVGCFGVMIVGSSTFSGCRGNDPNEPRTPPNSPIPEIDRPEEPKGPVPNPLSDGGGAAQSPGVSRGPSVSR
jgi:hypothetical protein